MRKIHESELQTADIILSTVAEDALWTSQAIRHHTHSRVSHALLYDRGGLIVESVGRIGPGGVTLRPLSEALHAATEAYVCRYAGLSIATRRNIVRFAENCVGTGYGWRKLLTHVRMLHWVPQGSGFLCSELVLEAYRANGAPIVDRDPAEASPGSIRRAAGQAHRLHLLGRLR